MIPVEGLAGVPVPPGDPDGVREGARALARAASAVAGSAARTSSLATSGTRGWEGPAASGYAARTTTTAGGLDRVGDGLAAAGRALDDFAEVLSDAQRRARRAGADLAEAGRQHARAVAAAAERGRVSASGMAERAAERAQAEARQAQRAAESRAAEALESARAAAHRAAEQAQQDVDDAARRAAGRLQSVVDGLRSTTLKDFLEWLGGPDVAFGLLGLFGQGVTAKGFYDARTALLAGDFAKLASMDPDGYRAVLRAAARHGDTSLEALTAQVRWQSGVVPRLMDEMSTGAVGLGRAPAGGLARTLTLLGRVGVGVSVVSNLATLSSDDPKTSGLDKAAAGANMVGLGMAATGSSVVTGLVGASAMAGWVPVVGQVVLAVTAAYMAYDWYRDNKELVHAFFDRVGDAAGAAVEWGEQELRAYADEVRRELDTARDSVVAAGQRAAALGRDAVERGEELLGDAERKADELLEDGEELLADAERTAGELLDDAGEVASRTRDRVVSTLNPFD